MKRYKHTLSHYRMVTGNMGDLMPVQCVPVLPGDTMQGHTSALIRVSPLNTPVMHPVSVRTHTFFVPNRIIWGGWEDFITGGNDGEGEGQVIPTSNTANGPADRKKGLLHYLGVGTPYDGLVNNLPLRAANVIYNEYYRDQDIVPPKTNTDQTLSKIAWEKDYFSTARPWTQRGPEVTLPLGTRADIKGIGNLASATPDQSNLTFTETGGDSRTYNNWYHPEEAGLGVHATGPTTGSPPDIWADLSTAISPSVNDFRTAFALQRYQEARARYGARFVEYLRYLGITPSDARLQRPEYLGGGASRISFSEVLQTTPTPDRSEPDDRDEIGVGDMYGHGIAGMKTGKWRRFFEEHGYVITMLSVRPKAVYVNSVPREFLKTTKEDFFQKELANLGQQEIYSQELHAGAAAGEVFGWQDRYQEYRSHPSQVGGDFTDLVNTFHMGRDLDENVALNQSFIECDPSRRVFQLTDPTYDTLWCMVNNHLVARRMVPKRANPRIL